jgi:hypothetical protein
VSTHSRAGGVRRTSRALRAECLRWTTRAAPRTRARSEQPSVLHACRFAARATFARGDARGDARCNVRTLQRAASQRRDCGVARVRLAHRRRRSPPPPPPAGLEWQQTASAASSCCSAPALFSSPTRRPCAEAERGATGCDAIQTRCSAVQTRCYFGRPVVFVRKRCVGHMRRTESASSALRRPGAPHTQRTQPA